MRAETDRRGRQKDLATLQAEFQAKMATTDPAELSNDFKTELLARIKAGDLAGALQMFDHKGLPARAANILGLKDRNHLFEKVGRLLASDEGNTARKELARILRVLQ